MATLLPSCAGIFFMQPHLCFSFFLLAFVALRMRACVCVYEVIALNMDNVSV